MRIVTGDLIEKANLGYYDIIIHGCNCFNAMNVGLASQIATAFPLAQVMDNTTRCGDIFKLGTYTKALIMTECDTHLIVINAYTQYRPDSDARYAAIESVLWLISLHFSGFTIAYPKIGCGIGGLDWNIVQKIFDKVLEGQNHTLIEYVQNLDHIV